MKKLILALMYISAVSVALSYFLINNPGFKEWANSNVWHGIIVVLSIPIVSGPLAVFGVFLINLITSQKKLKPQPENW